MELLEDAMVVADLVVVYSYYDRAGIACSITLEMPMKMRRELRRVDWSSGRCIREGSVIHRADYVIQSGTKLLPKVEII